MRLERGLEGRDQSLKFLKGQAREIEELGGAGLHIGEPYIGHTWGLLAWEAQYTIIGINSDAWHQACGTSPSVELQNCVEWLQRDYAAVKAALTLPWSTGPVEGHINRVKLIKRSGYGRMQLDLLQQRVLYNAA
jgi:hypothetical protein